MDKKEFVTEANLRDQKNPEGLLFSAETFTELYRFLFCVPSRINRKNYLVGLGPVT